MNNPPKAILNSFSVKTHLGTYVARDIAEDAAWWIFLNTASSILLQGTTEVAKHPTLVVR